jgi:hypothetical protein
MTRSSEKWGIDKRVGLATGVNLIQLITIIWLGASFYTQVSSNQINNEKRFQDFSEQRKVYDMQMTKMQDVQTQMLVQLSAMSERMSSTTDAIKEVRDAVRIKK